MPNDPITYSATMILLDCGYDETHEFSGDWIFGGNNNCHPAADPRWNPTVYTYYDDRLAVVWTTSTPLCDEQAIDEFTQVTGYGPGFKPVYLSAHRPGVAKEKMIPVRYNPVTDVASDL